MTTLWQAAAHQWGPGKIHVIDVEDPTKTYCGKAPAEFPGRSLVRGEANCRTCLGAIESRKRAAEYKVQYEQEQALREKEKEAERAQWREKYVAHMMSPEWRRLRALVLKRAGGMCEGCGTAPADQVHHLSYDHMGAEFLWELKAVCRGCHERWHGVPK